jgi:glycosyltransferase involved in cell wall biosynthesis
VVIPCYNEEQTLEQCISRVLAIQDDSLHLEIIIVDDCSIDGSANVARRLAAEHPQIVYYRHTHNRGKGAALRTGFSKATGDFVAVQDADLEYDPQDLKKLLVPLINETADVVFGSRFLSGSAHRVLYFWHALGNTFLTLLSNMLTDLNLTDMETCYKVFKREIIQSIDLQENRFGFEPEVVAKIAQMRVRIYEIGIAYYGRTYAEGKKIGMRDGWRALYCILKYNLHKAPWPVQFLFYIGIGGVSALVNLAIFLLLYGAGFSVNYAAPGAFIGAAVVNYILSITILFRHRARWNSLGEVCMFLLVTGIVGAVDLCTTRLLLGSGLGVAWAKIASSGIGLGLNFAGRRWLVFPEPSNPDWAPQARL